MAASFGVPTPAPAATFGAPAAATFGGFTFGGGAPKIEPAAPAKTG